MPLEIERKFLVHPELFPSGLDGTTIRQGYLQSDEGNSIRIRISGHQSFITIKGPDNDGVRLEFEYEIPFDDAGYMLEQFCRKPLINKTRRLVVWGGHLWEVDEFHGENQGLWLAEVELDDRNEQVELPPWVGSEVTGDSRYLNTSLVRFPFTSW